MNSMFALFPSWIAMFILMFVTIGSHHHHGAVICLAKEICEIDGRCNDEHTGHSDANHEEDENHCLSQEKFFPTDNLRMDLTVLSVPATVLTFFEETVCRIIRLPRRTDIADSSPPIQSWRMNC